MVLVAIVIGAGLVLTVGALVFRSHEDRTKETVAAVPTTATTAALAAGATTTTVAGPVGITYNDPNKIFRMTLGPDWTDGPSSYNDSPVWVAPVPGGTAR